MSLFMQQKAFDNFKYYVELKNIVNHWMYKLGQASDKHELAQLHGVSEDTEVLRIKYVTAFIASTAWN